MKSFVSKFVFFFFVLFGSFDWTVCKDLIEGFSFLFLSEFLVKFMYIFFRNQLL